MIPRMGPAPVPKAEPKGKGTKTQKWGADKEEWKTDPKGTPKKLTKKEKELKGKGKKGGQGQQWQSYAPQQWGYGQQWQSYAPQQYQDPRELQQQTPPAPAATVPSSSPALKGGKGQKGKCRFFAKGTCRNVAAGIECPFLHGST